MDSNHAHLQVNPDCVDAARDGDMAACETIYRQFERPVYTLAFRLCRHPEDAQEVLQDSFIKAFRRLHQYRGAAPFWPWLKRLVVNQALMRLRHDRVRHLWQQVSVPAASVETESVSSLDLNAALAALAPTARAVVWLHDVEGYTHAEIGKLMGKSSSFSKSQLVRARARLREYLTDHEVDTSCAVNLKSC